MPHNFGYVEAVCSGRIGLLALAMAMLNACRGPAVAAGSDGCPLFVRHGACVSPAVASGTCGARFVSTRAGCVPRSPCERGRALDLASGECLAHRESRSIAGSVGVLVEEDTILECDGNGTLASGVSGDAPRLGCLPPVPPPLLSCPVRAVAFEGRCAPIGGKSGPIDVVMWTRAVLGEGSPPLCRALQESPAALVVAGTVETTFHIDLTFPDNDVSQVVVSASPSSPELDHALTPLVEALRSLGGTANQALVAVSVTCRRTSERPRTISPR